MILATLCYLKRAGQTLMLHRNKKSNDIHEGKWNGLGGKFEAGESPEMCIRREVQEEAGLVINDARLHGLLIFVNFKGNDWYVFVFSTTDFEGDLIDSPEGRLEWIDDDKLLDLPLWPSDAIFLPWLKKDKFFSARFLYADDAMLRYEVTFH
jgi:8-oxo-dGTP diphosphatase